MRLPGLSRGFLDCFAVPGAFPPVLVPLVANGEGLFPLSDIRYAYSVLSLVCENINGLHAVKEIPFRPVRAGFSAFWE